MADNNLTIQIGADTTKAQADLKFLQAQLRAATAEMNKMARADVAKGLASSSAELQAQSAKVARLTKEYNALAPAVTRTNRAFEVLSSRGVKRLLSQFDDLSKTAQNLSLVIGRLTGSIAGGIVGAAAIKGLSTLTDLIADANKKLLELRDTAQQTGQSPAAIEAARRIAARTGRDATDADKILGSIAEHIAKVRTEAGKEIVPDGMKVLRGSADAADGSIKELQSEIKNGVTTLRGSSRLVFDLSKGYELLSNNGKKYKDTILGVKEQQLDTIQSFIKLAESGVLGRTRLNELSKTMFQGLPADAFLKIAPKLIADLNAEIEKLGPIEARMDLAERAKGARAETAQMFKDIFDGFMESLDESDIRFNEFAQRFFKETIPNWWRGLIADLGAIWPDLTASWNSGWQALSDNLSPILSDIMDKIKSALDWIIASVRAVGSAIGSIGTGMASGEIPAMPMASGGMVHGPGTGTSDSVLARVSNGEFVMRASAVSKWGASFMHALNSLQNPFGSFAAGGLVGSAPAFAEGGSAGGAPVHLHIGNNSFSLAGAPNVVSALVVEARRQQVRSAGSKPSWYGGMPGR
jgi:hypothetical protein